ncbi:MAG: NUDIX hydrolase [Chitinophagaceae bacterium]|nr:NUDIX hydrolase [Chitinophagaceae bacterium]
MNWKTIASEYLFRDLWFKVRKDTCERPDGKIVSPYYVYEFPTWVTAVAITRDGRFVFEKQYRHALGETIFEIPGGCVDPGDESLEAALARELKEETGYVFDNLEYLGKTSANPSTHNNLMHFFLATGGVADASPQLDDFEDIEVHLLSLEEVKRMLKQKEIVQAMHVTALMYALEKLGELTY